MGNNIKKFDEFVNESKLNEEIYGGSHFGYSKTDWLKLNLAKLSDNKILSYVNKRISLSDDEYDLINKKRDLLKKYTCVDKDGNECKSDIKKPYKIQGKNIIEIDKSEGWTTK